MSRNPLSLLIIPLDDINLADEKYKLSKNPPGERLKKSIAASGILDPPVLLRAGGRYVILFGHNRLRLWAGMGRTEAEAIVAREAEPPAFLRLALLKSHRNEIGPIGKLRLLGLLRSDFGYGESALASLAREELGVPEEVFRDVGLREGVLHFPAPLLDYLDARDVGFKVIRGLGLLPPDGLSLLAGWVEATGMRVNYFREIAESLADICRRDGSPGPLSAMRAALIEDRRAREELIRGEVFRVRYPEYSALKAEADRIIGEIEKQGFEVGFPPYFEGEEIDLHARIGKRDDIGKWKERLARLDPEKLKELLSLL